LKASRFCGLQVSVANEANRKTHRLQAFHVIPNNIIAKNTGLTIEQIEKL